MGSSLQNGGREFYGTDYHPGDYLFTFEDGRSPHSDTTRQRFDRLAAAAGLSRITFDDLRHPYATGALKAGVRPKVVSERIGHADVGFFLPAYAHVLKDDDRDAAGQAASFLPGDDWTSGSVALLRMHKPSRRAAAQFTSVHKLKRPPACADDRLACSGPTVFFSSGDISSGDRIRTCDLWVMS